MRVRNHGKYTRMSMMNQRGIGTCDYSGLMVKQSLMKDQLAYRGQGLVPTGFRVNPKFYDQPNPQDLTPLIKADPVPIVNARPDSVIDAYLPSNFYLDVSGDSNIDLTQPQYNILQFTNWFFTGELTGNIIISIPCNFYQFIVLNQTTGVFDLSIQIINNSFSNITIPKNIEITLACDSVTLTRIYNT